MEILYSFSLRWIIRYAIESWNHTDYIYIIILLYIIYNEDAGSFPAMWTAVLCCVFFWFLSNTVMHFMQIDQNQYLAHRDSSFHFVVLEYLSSAALLCKIMYEKEINGLWSKYCFKWQNLCYSLWKEETCCVLGGYLFSSALAGCLIKVLFYNTE